MTSPGTRSLAGGVTHLPSRFTRALIASLAFSASMALPAWRSSQKPIVALANSSTRMMMKSGQCCSDARQDHGHFDHPGDRSPKILEEFQQRVGFFLLDLVRAILGQPLCRLGLAEAIGDEPSCFSTSARGSVFRSSGAPPFASGVACASCVGAASGFIAVQPSIVTKPVTSHVFALYAGSAA